MTQSFYGLSLIPGTINTTSHDNLIMMYLYLLQQHHALDDGRLLFQSYREVLLKPDAMHPTTYQALLGSDLKPGTEVKVTFTQADLDTWPSQSNKRERVPLLSITSREHLRVGSILTQVWGTEGLISIARVCDITESYVELEHYPAWLRHTPHTVTSRILESENLPNGERAGVLIPLSLYPIKRAS